MRLTALQLELLRLLALADRYAITDRRVARALERKGLSKFFPKSDAWAITSAGRKVANQHGHG